MLKRVEQEVEKRHPTSKPEAKIPGNEADEREEEVEKSDVSVSKERDGGHSVDRDDTPEPESVVSPAPEQPDSNSDAPEVSTSSGQNEKVEIIRANTRDRKQVWTVVQKS